MNMSPGSMESSYFVITDSNTSGKDPKCSVIVRPWASTCPFLSQNAVE